MSSEVRCTVTHAVRKNLLIGRWQRQSKEQRGKTTFGEQSTNLMVGVFKNYVTKAQEVELNFENIGKCSKSDSRLMQNSPKIGVTISSLREENFNKVLILRTFKGILRQDHSKKNQRTGVELKTLVEIPQYQDQPQVSTRVQTSKRSRTKCLELSHFSRDQIDELWSSLLKKTKAKHFSKQHFLLLSKN